MQTSGSRHTIRQLIDRLDAGARVVWIANGTLGTVQPDKTILWEDGHHMTHTEMRDSHALLIYSEAEKLNLQQMLERRLQCLQRGRCSLVSWSEAGCEGKLPEHLCPLAVVSDPEPPAAPRRRRDQVRALRPAVF
jgi:hypothetical protein